jgi:hypothetical protein
MNQKAKQSQSSSKAVVHPVVLFGVDRDGKPTAARFPESHARLAAKAAEQLHLRVLTVATSAVAELAATLPVGRIHASGKGFVPNVRADLYAKLLAMAGPPAQVTQPSAQTPGRAQSNGGGAKTKKPAPHRLPKDWDAIAPGDLVIAQETLEDGWYDAIVLEQNGDMFTLRWHEFPRERRFARHRRSLGLLFPNIPGLPAKTGPTTGQQPAKSASARATTPQSKKGFPLAWDDIDVDHLVLAKDDGPCQSWWEAIPTEKHGDTFTLRWRDHSYLSKIVRPRLSLALLCPNAK